MGHSPAVKSKRLPANRLRTVLKIGIVDILMTRDFLTTENVVKPLCISGSDKLGVSAVAHVLQELDGLRAVAGETTGFAHSTTLTEQSIARAGETVRAVRAGRGNVRDEDMEGQDFYGAVAVDARLIDETGDMGEAVRLAQK